MTRNHALAKLVPAILVGLLVASWQKTTASYVMNLADLLLIQITSSAVSTLSQRSRLGSKLQIGLALDKDLLSYFYLALYQLLWLKPLLSRYRQCKPLLSWFIAQQRTVSNRVSLIRPYSHLQYIFWY
ncbi:hypothetical protein F5884DRAFT_771282, partial [Xylogone sp. PMI_703]